MASRQAPERNGAELRRSCKRKHYVLLVNSSIFTSLMESWCIIFAGIQFFRTNLAFPKALLPRCTQKISVRRHIFFHIHLSEQRKKKNRTCLSINISTDRHHHVPFDSPPFFPPLQIVLLFEPASRARDAQKAAQYVYSL